MAQALAGTAQRPRHVVASPGARHAPVLLALAAHPGLRVHMVLDERVAAFVALGLARACGRASVLCCTSGSAGAHFWPAVAEAAAGCVPLVVLTGDRPPELHASGAPQTMPQAQLYGGAVRWACSLPAPGGRDATGLGPHRTQTARALALAEAAPAGPVHLNVPLHEPLWGPEADLPGLLAAASAPVRRMGSQMGLPPSQAAALAACLNAAERGLIVCGPLPPDAAGTHAAAAVVQLAQALGWPLLADACSQVRFGIDGGANGLVATADALVRQPDFVAGMPPPQCIVRFGLLPTAKALVRYLAAVGRQPEVTTVLVEAHGTWQDPDHVADVHVVASASAVWAAVASELTVRRPGAWACRWLAADRLARHSLAQLDAASGPVGEAQIARALLQAAPAGALVHVASSMPIRDVETFGGAAEPAVGQAGVLLHCSRGLNGIDGTISCVLGLALGWSAGPVLALVGDLAFLHDIGALQAARQMAVSATLVVVNNAGGDIFSALPLAGVSGKHLGPAAGYSEAFDALFRTPQKADMQALCRAAGVHHVSVATLDALRGALAPVAQSAADANRADTGLRVIEVCVDAATSRAVRRAALAAVGTALQGLDTSPTTDPRRSHHDNST
jgi:2-succinyl-5-enolpyruvyl-6-hydroxy-3-cyclohexene-1-carboxylate synthase